MQENGLVSNYTVKQYKAHRSTCNNDKVENIVHREFDREKTLDVVVSDLTYVNVDGYWNYICLLLDLYNRENEYKNRIIDEVLETFKISRSLSAKGCPYDNAAAEATYKIIKTEFAFNRILNSFEELELELFD